MNQPRLRLGEILIESGLLSQQNLHHALEIQKQQQLRLGTILLQEGFVSEPHLLQALSRHLSIPWVSIWRIDVPAAALNLVPSNVAEEFFLMPIYIRVEKGGDKALYVAMNDPSDTEAMRFVAATAGMDVKPMIAGPADIASAIRYYYYGEEMESVPPVNLLMDAQAEEPVEDLSDEVELVSAEPLPIDLYASEPPEPAYTDAPHTSIVPPTDSTDQPDIAAASESSDTAATSSAAPSPHSRVSNAPEVEIPQRLSSAPTITEDGEEVYQNREAARREAERRIYGVGRKRAAAGFALTLLDGTTLSFSGGKDSSAPVDLLGEDAFLAALKAVTSGAEPPDMPIKRWQAYAAAALQILFRKGLFVYDEFIDEVSKIENK
ncbi:MAG: hypothetical protein JXX14_17220 [Deltaproteobacteria bacterium]|nr:hypothetical protein [Deltaproteobacteria bacterium]